MKRQHKGGGSTDYAQSFYAYGVDPAQLSRFTMSNINNATMFHPFDPQSVFPTGTSGVIPTGAYWNSVASSFVNNTIGPPTPGFIQMGGHDHIHYVTKNGKKIKNAWIAHVHQSAEANGMTYSEALKDARVRASYQKKH